VDDEIRGHMALSVKERIERGADPEAARLAALKEFGNVTLTRDSMRGVSGWRGHPSRSSAAMRLAVGSAPRHLLARVLSEGVVIAAIGIAAGGYALARVAARFFGHVPLPGAVPVIGGTAVQALRSE
jgi:hypothetical protein